MIAKVISLNCRSPKAKGRATPKSKKKIASDDEDDEGDSDQDAPKTPARYVLNARLHLF